MFKRMLWYSLWGAALVLILTVAVLPFVPVKERKLNVESFRLIKPGMTLKEVEELVGGPPGNYGHPSARGGMSTLEGTIPPPGTVGEKHWFNDNHLFEVYFDAKDQVTGYHKRFGYQQYPPESWLSKLWRRLSG